MTIDCLHGYFKFNETKMGELSDFVSLFELDLVSVDDYFTFKFLENAPDYSIKGGTYLGALATKTFEGQPWEIMRENNLVYDFLSGLVVPISTITDRLSIYKAANYYFSDGLLLPGSVRDDGLRVKDYSAGYVFGSGKFKYSEVKYG